MTLGVATRRVGALAALFATLVLLVTPSPASAHAELLESTPGPAAVVDAAPTEILLRFSEGVDPIDPAIRIVDADGREVARGAGDQSAGNDTIALAIEDATFAEGTYLVAWQAVSADSHNIRGAFTFSVGEESTTRTGLFDELFDSDTAQSATIGLLGVGRFASYAGVALLVGGLGTAATLFRSRAAARRTGRVLALGAILGVAGSAVMVGAQARLIGSSVFDIDAVAATTSGTMVGAAPRGGRPHCVTDPVSSFARGPRTDPAVALGAGCGVGHCGRGRTRGDRSLCRTRIRDDRCASVRNGAVARRRRARRVPHRHR